ncbi:MAG: alpha-ketoacid dehydrogenase subunit beta [Chloroflexi bacterium]|nr:alpha-ketoacid dehydrogenase subunit beta [Chloroflexota bacterium]
MGSITLIEAVREAMLEEMRNDPSVFVLGEDVGRRGGVFLATKGFIEEFGEARVLDTPLAEASIAGIAVGSAMRGLRPIAEIQFADFIWPTINQLIGEAARVRYGTKGKLHVPMVVRSPYGGHVRGGLYHSQSVESFFAHTPGLKVVVPSTPYDAKGLIKAAIRDEDPVIVLEHKRTYRSVRGEVPDDDYIVPIGSAEVKLPGDHATLITYGLTLHYSLQAAENLGKEGISIEVIDLRTLRPIDTQTIIRSVQKTNKVLIVQEDNAAVSVGSEISALVAENAFESLDAPIMRCSGPEIPAMPFAPTLEAAYMPTSEKIEMKIRELLNY